MGRPVGIIVIAAGIKLNPQGSDASSDCIRQLGSRSTPVATETGTGIILNKSSVRASQVSYRGTIS
jgi:hypothetical protein